MKTEENIPSNSEETLDTTAEDPRKPETEEAQEAELVLDDETEEYEEEAVGIKIKYSLTSEEISEFVKRSENYKKTIAIQKKHTIFQSLLFVLLLFGLAFTNKFYFLYLGTLPILAITLIWIGPKLRIRKFVQNMAKKSEFSVQVFADHVEFDDNRVERKIELDGTCNCEEFEDMLLLFSPDGTSLLIPLRAIEPEFVPDVTARILAGSKHK